MLKFKSLSPTELSCRDQASWHAFPREAYKSSILPELLVLSSVRSGGEVVFREKQQSTAVAGAGHNKMERQGKTGGCVLPACLGTQATQGTESTVSVKGSTSLLRYARAYNLSSCIITCRQLEHGSLETKTINIQSIFFLFPLDFFWT